MVDRQFPALPDDGPDTAPGTTLGLAKATCTGPAPDRGPGLIWATPETTLITDQPFLEAECEPGATATARAGGCPAT